MALAAVAPALVSGLFGLFGKKKTTQTRTNYVQLRDDALRAGFNPLTVLRATGGAGNTVTTQPKLSAGEFIGEALSRGLENWYNQDASKMDKEEQQLRIDSMRAELDGMKKKNPYGNFGYSIPAVTDQQPDVTEPKMGPENETRNINTEWGAWRINPKWDKAEKVSQEYEEVGAYPYAVGKILSDFGYNLGTRIGEKKLETAIRKGYRTKNPTFWTGSMGRTSPTGRFQWGN